MELGRLFHHGSVFRGCRLSLQIRAYISSRKIDPVTGVS